MTTITKVNSFEELLEYLSKGQENFFILQSDNTKSNKLIFQHDEDPTILTILNDSDGSVQVLTQTQLFDNTFTTIGSSINNGNFFLYI